MRRTSFCMLLVLLAALAAGLACSSAPQAPPPPPAPKAPPTAPEAVAVAPAPAATGMAYACEMGCEVLDKPGKCSKCGMNLVEVDRSQISYVCGTCSYKSDKPGACPTDSTALTFKIAEKKA